MTSSPRHLAHRALWLGLSLTVWVVACSGDETSSSAAAAGTTSSGGGASSSGAGGTGGAGGAGGAAETCTEETVTELCEASTTCRAVSCELGACKVTLAPKGTACTEAGGAVCDGEGLCVPMHCQGDSLDGNESDVDCGGSCPACEDGKACKVAKDCESGRCAKGASDALECQACASHADCEADRYCDATTKRCLLDRNVGDECDAAEECPGTNCVDGVCCESACSSACSTCRAQFGATKDGVCTSSALTNQVDPGNCDHEGNGNCGGAECGCDENGMCTKVNGELGEACGKDAQCASGFCVDGVCCDTACEGLCQACSLDAGAAKDGSCGPVTVLVQDLGTCDDTNGGCGAGLIDGKAKCACNAQAECKRAKGEPCNGHQFCASGTCKKVNLAFSHCL